jgi:hypothetical protein
MIINLINELNIINNLFIKIPYIDLYLLVLKEMKNENKYIDTENIEYDYYIIITAIKEIKKNNINMNTNIKLQGVFNKLANRIHNNIPRKTHINIQDIIVLKKAELPLEVDYFGPIEKPHDNDYGGDFKSKLIIIFKIPETNVIDKIFKGLIIKMNCTDQNFGGTKQSNIRYSINDVQKGSLFYIDRNENPSNNYEISLEDIKYNDTISLWLCCPPWNGWKAIVNNYEIIMNYYNKL